MEPPVFYAVPQSYGDSSVTLSADESRHAVDVMRLSRADMVIVVDGLGNAYRGEIARIVGKKRVEVKLHSHIRNFGEPNVRLTLACGLSAGYKFDTVVQKGTELGVTRFVPLLTEKSKVRLDAAGRAGARVARYEKVALAAIKQCRRSFRPEIARPVAFEEYMKEIDSETLNLIFHDSRSSRRLDEVRLDGDTVRVNIMVGPESGFVDTEIQVALEKGIIPITLGKRVLRTENAGPVACALVMSHLGELR